MSEEKNKNQQDLNMCGDIGCEKSDDLKNCEKEQGEFRDDGLENDQNNELEKLKVAFEALKDRLYRENADFENSKKRMQKDLKMAVDYANEDFAKDMLPVIDALDAALNIDVKDNEFAVQIKDGVKQCVAILLKNFEKHGITPIDASGKFDHNIHNAVSQIEVEGKESGDIVQVYQKGYMYKGRVLRAAMVVVAK